MWPRPPIAVAPLAISTETCLQLGGLQPRKFRDALARFPQIPRSRDGHTLLVTASAFAELLDLLRVSDGEEVGADQAEEDDDQPKSIDDVLRRIGRERV